MSRRAMSASGVLDSPIANRGCDCRSITTQLRPIRVSRSDMRLPAKPEPIMAKSESTGEDLGFQCSVFSFQTGAGNFGQPLLLVVHLAEALFALWTASGTGIEFFEIPKVSEDASAGLFFPGKQERCRERFFHHLQRGAGELTSCGELFHQAVAAAGGDDGHTFCAGL